MSKVIELNVNNVMRLKAVHIRPSGGIVQIGGGNAEGKTSVLESIAMAIGGLRLAPKEPIRSGELTASIHLSLGDITVHRTFSRETLDGPVKSQLAVRNANGDKLHSPQAVLNELFGTLSFDPLEFSEMVPRERARVLRELVGLDVEQLEEEQTLTFDRRTEKGREKRAAEAVVADMPFWDGVGVTETSVTEIGQRMVEATERVREHAELHRIAERADAVVDDIDRRKTEFDAQIDQLRQTRDSLADPRIQAVALLNQANTAVSDFIVPDVSAIQSEFNGVEAINTKVRGNLRRAERVEDAEMVAAEWKELDTKHTRITADIKRRTEAVEYPIPDLDLRKEGVYYQGVPFEQGSRAERIKVSIAMGCALNKNLKVLLIRDGSVLDDESMKVIAQIAEDEDFQFWIEMARGFSSDAIVIEDGEVQGG